MQTRKYVRECGVIGVGVKTRTQASAFGEREFEVDFGSVVEIAAEEVERYMKRFTVREYIGVWSAHEWLWSKLYCWSGVRRYII